MKTITTLLVLSLLAAPVPAYEIDWWTTDGGGGTSAGGGFSLTGTAGQPDAGAAAGGDFELQSGFWTLLRAATPAEEAPVAVNRLLPNAPNPFNPKTTLRFDLADAGRATIQVYDVRGRLQVVLLDEQLPAGRHALDWNGTNDRGRRLASGVYFVRMRAGDFEARQKAVLLK